MANRNLLVPWLNDAYAMETALLPIFEAHAAQATDQPVVASRLEEHLDRTRSHQLAIRGCVERLAHHPSALKTGAGSLIGSLQTMSAAILGDAVLRNLLADYAAQKYQIAYYRALTAVASEMGDASTLAVCQELLAEEEEMAAWIERQQDEVVRETLRRKTATR